ncbi:hypothetical protein MTO96_001831 [Rhipicephalus appendiculatus]
MAAPSYFPEAFVFLAAIARQHRGRKELDDAFGLPASERVRRHLDCIARKKKGAAVVRRSCREDARPTPLSVELVGVVRPVRPSVFRDWQLSSLFGKRGDCCRHATRGEQAVRDVVAEVIVRAGIRKWFHFPWTPDEKGAFKNVSSAAGVIGCVDGSVAVIIAPKGDHHKAASYSFKKHYADIMVLPATQIGTRSENAGCTPPPPTSRTFRHGLTSCWRTSTRSPPQSPPRRTIRQSTPALPTCGPLARDSATVGISNVTTVAYAAASHTSIVLLSNTPPCFHANSGNNSARSSPVSWAANDPGISSATSSTLLPPSRSLGSNYNEWSGPTPATLRR